MKLQIFSGTEYDVKQQFNEWAKGKALTREILIHEQVMHQGLEAYETIFALFVYYPEGSSWEEMPQMMTAPIHQKPEPHVKLKEVQVTQ